MGKRNLNYRLVKIHRNYEVAEVAELLGVHRNTVRNWVKREGLCTIDDKRPMLFHGAVLREYLENRRVKNKQPLEPGEIYCVGCHAPKVPAGNMVDCLPVTETLGNLQAICPDCGSIMYRRINLTKIEDVCGNMELSFPKG